MKVNSAIFLIVVSCELAMYTLSRVMEMLFADFVNKDRPHSVWQSSGSGAHYSRDPKVALKMIREIVKNIEHPIVATRAVQPICRLP